MEKMDRRRTSGNQAERFRRRSLRFDGLAATCCVVTILVAPLPAQIRGDANCDGVVDVRDIRDALPAMFVESACGAADANGDGRRSAADAVALVQLLSPLVPVGFDCAASQPGCAEIVIDGDPPSRLPNGPPSPFRGFADPSVRRDPTTGALWMAYSWPRLHVGATTFTPGIDIHLARSDDDGGTWNFVAALWESQGRVSPSGIRGFEDHEVANILPMPRADEVDWYAARLAYFIPEGGGFGARVPSSFRLVVARAASPAGLADAPAASLGSRLSDARWGIDVDLTTLSPHLERCDLWNEPALHVRDA